MQVLLGKLITREMWNKLGVTYDNVTIRLPSHEHGMYHMFSVFWVLFYCCLAIMTGTLPYTPMEKANILRREKKYWIPFTKTLLKRYFLLVLSYSFV